MELLLKLLAEELEVEALEGKIQQRVREYMDRANHEYYLREQIHAIQDELGDNEDEEIAELRAKLAKSKMNDEARERVSKELKRLARTAVQAPESAVSQNYIEYMLELPWDVKDPENIDIRHARRVLEADHYGMKEVKERLIEFLAVRAATKGAKSPILCLVGPPGVGKTSIARSVARALGRKFTQVSLGGVHDEAEIRGHRKTYVGAMPGKIISQISQCGTMNPVFLFDEIDKMASDMRGDPASAMLEVLDPEQNREFRDHYLEAPFDLSDVLFITTANTTETIDRALLDRMELIEVPSYTLEEKVQIARRHLLPKELEAHGLKKAQLKLSEKAFSAIIDGYTRESGVRTLERLIGKICRKVTLEFVENPEQRPGGDQARRPEAVSRRAGLSAHAHRAEARRGRGQRPRVDERRRRGHAGGSRGFPGKRSAGADGQSGRRDEGIGPSGAQHRARAAEAVWSGGGFLRKA